MGFIFQNTSRFFFFPTNERTLRRNRRCAPPLRPHHVGLQPNLSRSRPVAAADGPERRVERRILREALHAAVPEEKVIELHLAGERGAAAGVALRRRGSRAGHQHRGNHRNDAA